LDKKELQHENYFQGGKKNNNGIKVLNPQGAGGGGAWLGPVTLFV